jgi:hypothetical protein
MGPGYRAVFGWLCQHRYDGIDLTQVFFWAASSLGFDCLPSKRDQKPHYTTVQRFKTAYNAAFDDLFTDIEGAERFPEPVTSTEDEALFCGIFDCYEYNLRQELGEDADGVAQLRALLTWVDGEHMIQGFGERYPIENASQDNYRSQTNRRVEVMMFDEGQEPDLVASAADPEVSDVYLPGLYNRRRVRPMPNTLPLQAMWFTYVPTWAAPNDTALLVLQDSIVVRRIPLNEATPFGLMFAFDLSTLDPRPLYQLELRQGDVLLLPRVTLSLPELRWAQQFSDVVALALKSLNIGVD